MKTIVETAAPVIRASVTQPQNTAWPCPWEAELKNQARLKLEVLTHNAQPDIVDDSFQLEGWR